MGARYYNLKLGSKGVFGGVIKVDPAESSLDKRIQAFCADGDYQFKLVGSEIYDLIIPHGKYVTAHPAPAFVEEGSPTLLRMGLAEDGELKLIKRLQGKKAYLSEISESQARKLQEEKQSFDMMRAYVCS